MSNLEYVINKWNLENEPKRYGRIEIPNTTRLSLTELFKELGYKVGAEIGVQYGIFSEIMLLANPGVKLYGIDPYMDYAGRYGRDVEVWRASAKERLAPYNFEFVRKTSMNALSGFEDNSLDFVYIDGDHEFAHVANDIVEWTKKVRPGGIVSGHDYSQPRHRDRSGKIKENKTHHVQEAVDGYMAGYRVDPWFVLGRKHCLPGETQDKLRSWFFVKK